MLEKRIKSWGKAMTLRVQMISIHLCPGVTAGRLFSVYDHSYKQQKYSSVSRFLSLSIHRTDEAPICILAGR